MEIFVNFIGQESTKHRGEGGPLLEQEGRTRYIKKCREATLAGAAGVVSCGECSPRLTTPSAPFRWLRSIFLMAQPTLLFQEGNTLAP